MSNCDYSLDMSDIVNQLNIKAGVMEMGERIAWGSDTALMREAASEIEKLRALVKLARDAYLAEHSDGETDCVTPYDYYT